MRLSWRRMSCRTLDRTCWCERHCAVSWDGARVSGTAADAAAKNAARSAGFLESLVRTHRARQDALEDGVTVCSTPNGVSSYLSGQQSAPVRSVRLEQGCVVTR